jgi:3-oxoadipate enol-lactonase
VLERGTEWFVDLMAPKLLGKSTQEARPDLVADARRMMLQMSPQDIAQVQQGMAARPDSVTTLKTINVPALVVLGEEDTLIPLSDGELMRQHIANSRLAVIPKAGHFALWEQPETVGKLIRQFVDGCQ